MATATETPMDRILSLIEDRCGAAAELMETLAETMIDRHCSVIETTALEAGARELRTLESAAARAQGHSERIPELASQLEKLWCGQAPKSLMVDTVS